MKRSLRQKTRNHQPFEERLLVTETTLTNRDSEERLLDTRSGRSIFVFVFSLVFVWALSIRKTPAVAHTTLTNRDSEERLLDTRSGHGSAVAVFISRDQCSSVECRVQSAECRVYLSQGTSAPVQQCRVEEIPRRLKLTTECLVFSGKSPHTWSVTLRRNSLGAWLILSIQLRTCQTAWGEVPMFKRLWCSQHLLRPLMAKLTRSTRQRHHVMPDASHYLWSFQRTMAL